jgi:hypothetical protein
MPSFDELYEKASANGTIRVSGYDGKYDVKPFNSSLSFTPVSDGGPPKLGKLVSSSEDVSRYEIIGGRRRRGAKKSRKVRKSRSRKSRRARR